MSQLSGSLRHLKQMWHLYSKYLDSHPYTTQALTAGFFFVAGDVLSQYIEHRFANDDDNNSNANNDNNNNNNNDNNAGRIHKKQWSLDYMRTLRMGSYGLFVGPIAHVWYRFLDKRFVFKSTAAATATATAAAVDSPVSRFSWSVLKPVFIKVCLDEAIMGTFEIVTLFSFVSMLDGKDLTYVRHKIRSQFWEVFKVDLALWPAVQTINFLYVPNKYRMLYIGIFNVLWNAFLSFIQNQDVLAEGGDAPQSQLKDVADRSTIGTAIPMLSSVAEQNSKQEIIHKA